jgi:bacterioferritin-associated ferredoxin
MLICHCHAITDREIRASIQAGAGSVCDVGEHCGAGTGCGGCFELLEEIVADELAASGARRRATALPVLGRTLAR